MIFKGLFEHKPFYNPVILWMEGYFCMKVINTFILKHKYSTHPNNAQNNTHKAFIRY